MDELWFFYISMLSLLLLILFISLYLLNFLKSFWSTSNKQLMLQQPGTTGWPIIGESTEFQKAARMGNPEKFFYDRMKKYSTSEIFKTSLIGVNTSVLCGASGNKFLFTNEYKLLTTWQPPAISKIFPFSQQASSSEQELKKIRKLYPLFLKPESLQRYVGIMDSVTKRHFDTYWHDKKEMTVYKIVKSYTFSLACRLFLSIEDQALIDKLLKPFTILSKGFTFMPINLPGTPFNRAIKAAAFLRKEFTQIMKERRNIIYDKDDNNSPPRDLLSQMIRFTDEEHGVKFMNEIEIADSILGLMVGGHDTAASVITVVMKYLVELPDVYNKVQKEQTEIANSKATGELLNWDDIQKMKYSWNVVCEVMRLAPPAQGAFKQAITDFTYAGYFIPKGWKLFWSAISTHKDPEYFPDPQKFDPSRFEGNGPAPYTFIPFGGGAGMCPGKEFARLEILVFIHHVVRKYKWEKLIPNDDTISFNPFPFPAEGLPIRVHALPVS